MAPQGHKRSRPRDRDRKGRPSTGIHMLGRWDDRQSPGSGIRKPGDLPVNELQRANGVCRDRLMDGPYPRVSLLVTSLSRYNT